MIVMKPALAFVTGLFLLASGCGGCECPAYSIAVFFKSGDPFVDGLHGLQVTIDGQTTLCQVDSSIQPETVDCDGAGFEVNFSRESVALILLDDEPGVQVSLVVSARSCGFFAFDAPIVVIQRTSRPPG